MAGEVKLIDKFREAGPAINKRSRRFTRDYKAPPGSRFVVLFLGLSRDDDEAPPDANQLLNDLGWTFSEEADDD